MYCTVLYSMVQNDTVQYDTGLSKLNQLSLFLIYWPYYYLVS